MPGGALGAGEYPLGPLLRAGGQQGGGSSAVWRLPSLSDPLRLGLAQAGQCPSSRSHSCRGQPHTASAGDVVGHEGPRQD